MSIGEFLSNLGFSFVPVLLLVLLALVFSSYIKIITVLAIVRAGLGSMSLPGAFVTGSLALALSFFVMYPTIDSSLKAMDGALASAAGQSANLRQARAVDAGIKEWKKFLVKQSDGEIVNKFVSKINNNPEEAEGLKSSWRVLAPSFFVSELKAAFATGLSLFLPFVILDLCIAHVLVALGLSRLDPLVVSLPFKILLFVMVDGWTLISTNLVGTYF